MKVFYKIKIENYVIYKDNLIRKFLGYRSIKMCLKLHKGYPTTNIIWCQYYSKSYDRLLIINFVIVFN